MTRSRLVLALTLTGAMLFAFSVYAQAERRAKAGGSSTSKAGAELRLLRYKEVQDDIQLTAEQKEQLEQADTVQKVTEALKPEQIERLKQIRFQSLGAGALADPAVAKELKINPQQRGMFKMLPKQIHEQEKSIAGDTKLSAEEKRAKIAEMQKQLTDMALDMLTPEQREQYQKMAGRKINLDFLKSAEAEGKPKKSKAE